MNTPAIVFSVYFLIGLILMIVAVATPGKEKRTKGFEAAGGGDAVDAALLLFVALLWPLWLMKLVAHKDDSSPPDSKR